MEMIKGGTSWPVNVQKKKEEKLRNRENGEWWSSMREARMENGIGSDR